MKRWLLAAALLAACSDSTDHPPADTPDAGAAPTDPFAYPPDTSEGLTNVSADLDAVLEDGALATACADYAAAPTDRRLRLLCGKAMFFYEGFGTAGVPTGLVTWLIDSFPDEVGPGFAELGMIADPGSPLDLPLGLAPGAKLGGTVDTYAFTCASCHFARLPDGRYAVGAPNHAYQYGRMNVMLMVLPALSIPGADPAAHDPDALAIVQPLRDKMAADPAIGNALITALLPLISSGAGNAPAISKANEHHYATWRSGTMDFFIQPLPFDDEVHTISKISALWGIARPDEAPSAFLSWTGGTLSMLNFARGFVDLGGGVASEWSDDELGPLVDYVHSLRAPENPTPPAAADVTAGAGVFTAECASCHDGPRGGGRELYDYADVGTDDALKAWVDADLDGVIDGDFRFQPGDTLTHQLKSPRLVGLWAMTRFLHNGSLDSLDQLLCLAPRAGVSEPAYGDAGHTYGCDAPEADRRALLAFLLSH